MKFKTLKSRSDNANNQKLELMSKSSGSKHSCVQGHDRLEQKQVIVNKELNSWLTTAKPEYIQVQRIPYNWIKRITDKYYEWRCTECAFKMARNNVCSELVDVIIIYVEAHQNPSLVYRIPFVNFVQRAREIGNVQPYPAILVSPNHFF